jgi:hypothetical protein
VYQTEVGGRLLKQTVNRPLAPRKREVAEAHPDGMRERCRNADLIKVEEL